MPDHGCCRAAVCLPSRRAREFSPRRTLDAHRTVGRGWTNARLRRYAVRIYLKFIAYPKIDMRNEATSCCDLSGKAHVCTAEGAKYQFDMSGSLSGAWLRTEGAKVSLGLGESAHPKVPRTFQLSGVWRGLNLVLDDQKTLISELPSRRQSDPQNARCGPGP